MADFASRLRSAANRCTRVNADVALLCEMALDAAMELDRINQRHKTEISKLHELADEMFATLTAALFLAPHNSPVRAALDEAVENIRPKWLRPSSASLVGLRQGDSLIPRLGDVDQSVSGAAAGTQEVDAGIVNLRGDGREHNQKAASPAGPHSRDATPDSVRDFLLDLQERNAKDNGLFPQEASAVEADEKALRRVLAVLDFYYPPASVISFADPNLGPKTDHFPLPPAKAQAYADNNGLPPAGVQEARESDLAAFAARVRPPVPDSDERIEEAAKMLWHRFAPGHREDWNDEPHKDEYRSAARALLAGSASIADKALKRDAWLNETCAELWAMAQGPVPISNAVDRMVNHLRERLQGKGGA